MYTLQFGTEGAFLSVTIRLDSKNLKSYTIGDRYNIDSLYIKHNTLGEYDLSGAWYIYNITFEGPTPYMITLRLIRNGSKHCLPGDGTSIQASQVESLFGIKNYKAEEDFFITLRTDKTVYHSLVRASYRLKYKALPIFMPDGSLKIVNFNDRPIVEPLLYHTITAEKATLSFQKGSKGIEEYPTATYILDYFQVHNLYYPAGTIIKYDINSKQAIIISDISVNIIHGHKAGSSTARCYLIAQN
jgi:hypothetical protein